MPPLAFNLDKIGIMQFRQIITCRRCRNIGKNCSKGSFPRILIFFFLLCLSVLFITKGKLGPLAGIYIISFLMVMIYFGFGNFLLKIKRRGYLDLKGRQL